MSQCLKKEEENTLYALKKDGKEKWLVILLEENVVKST